MEQNPPTTEGLAKLSEAQQAQFNKGMADVSAAMSWLSDALRGSDNATLPEGRRRCQTSVCPHVHRVRPLQLSGHRPLHRSAS